MKMKFSILIFEIFFLVLFLGTKAIDAQKKSDDGFADYLYKKGEYYRAITEYYRLLYYENDTDDKIKLLRNIGLCYFKGESYQKYISFINKYRTDFQLNIILKEMDLYLGKSCYALGQYPKAITTLEWSNVNSKNIFFDETQFLLGISYARIFDWQAATKKMQLIKQNSSYKKCADHFIQSKDEFYDLSNKRPFLAGILSTIIPGTGYLYSGRSGTGITSLMINGLLMWAMRDAIINKQYGLASATGFFTAGWYIGNIKGSRNAAETYNANIRNKFIDELLKKENFDEYIKSAK